VPFALRQFGQAAALITPAGETLTYNDTAAAADNFATHIGPRKLVFILASNCAESVIGYLGCLGAKAPAALLAPNIHPDLLSNLLHLYRPHYLWLPRGRASVLPAGAELFALGDYVLGAYCTEPLEVFDQLALLMPTSGTTGSPKFVRQSYSNLASNAAAIASYLQICACDKAITTLPMHYVYGLSIINSHLQAGAAVVLTTAGLMEKRFWELLNSQQVTSLAGVPYTYEQLKRLAWHRMQLPSLRTMTQAGGKLHPSLAVEFASHCLAKGILFYLMYGASEATARMCYLPPHLALEKSASVGIPIPGGELWLEDETRQPITQPNVSGELCYRGPNVALGYAHSRADLALGDEFHGTLRTGDLAHCDEDGHYYITGRKSRFIKLFGNRVSLEDMEQLIRNAGIDCACTGDDQALRVYVSKVSEHDDIASFVQQLTNLHRSVIKTTVIDSIPRNEAGKIIYAELP
jgi:acyl-CoA synthetase (AMP-forming)/AMP-acid ligase II